MSGLILPDGTSDARWSGPSLAEAVTRRPSPSQKLDDLNLLMMNLGRRASRGEIEGTAACRSFAEIAAAEEQVLEVLEAKASQVVTRFYAAKTGFVALTTAGLLRAQGAEPAVGSERFERMERTLLALGDASGNPLQLSARNNHRVMHALTLLALGAESGNAKAIARADDLITAYLTRLDEGGLPEPEAVRGASAAWYINTVLLMLTAYAHLAPPNGGLAGSTTPQRLWDEIARIAVALDRAVADPATLHRYSRQNMYANPLHSSNPLDIDLGFLRGYHSGRHYMVWLHLLPDDLDARELLPGIHAIRSETTDPFPYCNDFIGGYLDSLYGGPPGISGKES